MEQGINIEFFQTKCCYSGYNVTFLEKCLQEVDNSWNSSSKTPNIEITTQISSVCVKSQKTQTVIMWGAQTYMSLNIAHVVLCTIMFILYCSVPELGKSLYNRAVLRHYLSSMIMGITLNFLAFCDTRGYQISDTFLSTMWLVLQYFTLSAVFWLNIICVHMSMMITRFRWAPVCPQKVDEENHRLFIYSLFTWGGAFLPTMMAAFFEFFKKIPKDFVLRAGYSEYRNGPRPIVNLYFFLVPAITLFLNNILFVFTSYKIVIICRSTELATKNQKNQLRKNYFLFLKLYLSMGSPWLFGSILACMNRLIVLKVCRATQPVLWLLTLLGDRHFRENVKRRVFRAEA